MAFTFAGYPSAFVFEAPNGKKIDHLLWGDFIRLLGPEIDSWVNVRIRATTGWMRKQDIQQERLLEINFVDIGQGDGCFIVTPDDKFMLLDAGEGDNMIRFLRWRFNLKKHPEQVITMQSAVISHSDADHYKGFKALFDDPQFKFETVYHNGIVERAGDDPLGPTEKINGVKCLTGVVPDKQTLKPIIENPANVGRSLYPNLMKAALQNGRVGDIRMLCSVDGFMPGYEADKKLVIRALGPVPEPGDAHGRLLRYFSDQGKTKNGHSVILKLEYGNVKVMLGGDLNIPSENHLLRHYTQMDPLSKDVAKQDALVGKAREVFESDVAKACHHGSGDFNSLFLRAVNPIATIISSGDDESHAHPRPDALGTFGKHGRGERPLIFSTELARSAKETIKNPNALRKEIKDLFLLREKAENDEVKAQLDKKIEKLLENVDRTVTVYGLINVRTDGKRVVIAQKLESPAPRGEWDLHQLEPDANGHLHYVTKH